MKRRNFIHLFGTGAVLPLMVGGLKVRAFANDSPMLSMLANVACEDRVLVLIQLAGGNDGLNTVIPLDQYGNYKNARPNIAVLETDALKLTDATGLHPNMAGMKQLYDNGKLNVVQSVGYPTPDFSHFRSTDIWLTASDYDKIIDTGWLGRWLDTLYPGFPIGYPNSNMPHPVAIQIGNTVSTALEAQQANMGMAFSDPNSFFNINNYGNGTNSNTRFHHELDFIRQTGLQIQNFASPVKTAAGKVTNKSSLYPAVNTGNTLSESLKVVARMIAGGLKTRIYIVTQSGYDTHAAQNTGGNGTPIAHPVLLQQLSQAITAFQDDIRLLGVEDRVVGMTFSEFGRRIKQNGSNGTDHGAAAPLFVFGSNVKQGVIGSNPLIPSTVSAEDNIPMQYDFRSVYASLYRDWLCVSESSAKDLLFNSFPTIPIIKGSTSTSVESPESVQLHTMQVSPNPVRESVRISFNANGAPLKLSLFDYTGKEIAVLVESTLPKGTHEISYNTMHLANGNYYVRLQNGSTHSTSSVVLLR